MIKKLLPLIVLLAFALPAFGQGARFEGNVVQAATVAGFNDVVTFVSTAQVNLCVYPASGTPCLNKATTYTNATLTTPCANNVQLTLPGSSSCVSTTDAFGNWGVWVAPGNYSYTITIAGFNLGPYTFSAGAIGNGGIINVITPPSGACTAGITPQQVISTGVIYNCQNLLWVPTSSVGTFIVDTLTSTSTMSLPSGNNYHHNITLSTSVTSSSVSGSPIVGNLMKLHICQPGVGGPFTFSFPANFLNPTTVQTTGCTDETFTYDGTNWSQLTQPASGGGGGGSPASPINSLQKNNVGSFGPSVISDTSGQISANGNFGYILGPNPSTYVNARTINPNAWPQGTGTCNNGNTTFTFTGLSPALFTGDGVFLPGCGGANGLTTPTITSVTPVLESDGLNTGHSVAAPAGGTQYCYSESLFDTAWGMTPASAQVCSSTGPSSLGTQTISFTTVGGFTCTRVLFVTTCNMASSAALAPGAVIHISGTSADGDGFGGDPVIATIPNGTTITFNGGMNVANGGNAAVTGGSLTYHVGMQIQSTACPASGYEYALYGNTSGAQNFLQFSRPVCLALGTDPSAGIMQDWGSSVSGGTITAPFWVPTTAPSSAINDGLVATVSGCNAGCSGSGSLTLSVAPSNAANPSTTMTMDEGPLFTAADTLAKNAATGEGYIYAPFQPIASGNSCYPISSFISISSDMIIGDPICDRSTLKTSGALSGLLAPNTVRKVSPSFALSPQISVAMNGYPGVWSTSGRIDHLTISSAGNNYLNTLVTNTNPIDIDHVNFSVQNQALDCIGTLFLHIGTNGGAFGGQFSHNTLTPGPGTATPGVCHAASMLVYQNTEYNIDYLSANERGVEFIIPSYGLQARIYIGNEMQSCATPAFMFNKQESGLSGLFVNIDHGTMDTASCPVAANWSSSIGGVVGGLVISHSGPPSSNQPFVTGKIFPGLTLQASGVGAGGGGVGQNALQDTLNGAAGPSNNGINAADSQSSPDYKNRDMILSPTNSVFATTAPAPAVTTAVVAGGGIAVGAHTISLAPVFPNGTASGSEGVRSVNASFTTTTGNQSVTVTNYTVVGAIGYNVYVDGFRANQGCSLPQVKTNSGFTFTGGTCGQSQTNIPGGGPAVMAGNGVIAANQILPNLLDNTAFCDQQIGVDVGLKANYAITSRLPSTGGTIDCTGPQGAQNISVNMTNSIVSGGWLFKFGASQNTLTGTLGSTATQVIPNSTRLQGIGQGGSNYGTYFVAGGSFPTSTPMFQLGRVALDQAAQISGITADCNNISGSIGVQNTLAQELSYLKDVTLKNCSGTGFQWSGNNAQNSGPMDGLNCITGTGAGATTTCFTISGLPSSRGLYNFTANMNIFTTQPNVGVSIDGTARVENGQMQSMVTGAEIGAVTGANGVIGKNLHCNSVTNCIDIASTNNPQNVNLFNIQAATFTSLINDHVTGCNYTGTSAMHYGLGPNTGAGRFSIESSLNTQNCLPTFGWGMQIYEAVPAFGAHSGYDILYVDPTSHNLCLYTAASSANCTGAGSLPSGVFGQYVTNNGTGAAAYSATSPTVGVANAGAGISLASATYTLLCDSATVATGVQDRSTWANVITGGANNLIIPDQAGTGCSGMIGGIENSASTTITVSRQTTNTLNIYLPNAAAPTNANTFTLAPGQHAIYFPNKISATQYDVHVAGLAANSIGATQLAAQYSKGSCTEAWGGSGTSFALTTGDDAVVNNTCYNDSGVTRTITAVKCRSDNATNTTTVNPTFGSAGTGTAILTGALTCGSSYAYSASGTVSNASWTTGTGIDPAMGGTLTGTSIAVIVEYTF